MWLIMADNGFEYEDGDRWPVCSCENEETAKTMLAVLERYKEYLSDLKMKYLSEPIGENKDQFHKDWVNESDNLPFGDSLNNADHFYILKIPHIKR